MITFNKKNQVIFMVDTEAGNVERRPSFRRSASQVSQGFQGFGEALWYKAKGAGRAVSGVASSAVSSLESAASFVGEKITGAAQYAENKITSAAGTMKETISNATGAVKDTVINTAETVKEKASDVIQPIYDVARETKEEIDASKINKENKRDIEAARKEFKKVEKYSLSIDKLQERIDVKEKDIRGLEEKFAGQSGKADNLRIKIENEIKAQEKLNDMKLERVKVEGLIGDIERLDKKIDQLKLTNEQKKNFDQEMKSDIRVISGDEKKLFDEYRKLKNIQDVKQGDLEKTNAFKNRAHSELASQRENVIERLKYDIKIQENSIEDHKNEIKQVKAALANEIGGGFKNRSEVNKYEKLLKEQNGLEKEKNEKIERGAQSFQKAEQILKVDKEKGEGVLTKLEQKVQEVKEHDARYKGSVWEKIKDATLGAVNYVTNPTALFEDTKRKIFGASGEKGRDEVTNKVENLEKASLWHDRKGIHSIVEKVQEKDAVKMAQQVGKESMTMKPTTEMNSSELKDAQQKPRDVFRGDQGAQR